MAFDPKILMSFVDLQTLIDTEGFTQKNAFPNTSLKLVDKLEAIDALNIDLTTIAPLTDNQLVAREFLEAIVVGDNPPTAPTVIETGVTNTTASISWSGATDDFGIDFYNLWGQEPGDTPVFIDQVSGTTSIYTFINLQPGSDYRFYVIAEDTAGQPSSATGYVDITTTMTEINTLLTREFVGDSSEHKLLEVYNATQTQDITVRFTLIIKNIKSYPRIKEAVSTNIEVSPLVNIGDSVEYTKSIGVGADVQFPIELWYSYAGENMTVECEVITSTDPPPPSVINIQVEALPLKWITELNQLSRIYLYITSITTQLINWEVEVTAISGGPHYLYYSTGADETITDETDGVPFTGYTNSQILPNTLNEIGNFNEYNNKDTETTAVARITYASSGHLTPPEIIVNLGAHLLASYMTAGTFVSNNYLKNFIVGAISGGQPISIRLTVVSINIVTPGAYLTLSSTTVQYINDFVWLDFTTVSDGSSISLPIQIVNGGAGDTATVGCEVRDWIYDFPPVDASPSNHYLINLG